MPTTFDAALPDLVAACERLPAFADVRRAAAIRDVRGRVRLVLDAPADFDPAPIDAALRAALGAWFAGPVLCNRSGPAGERRLGTTLLDRAQPWPGTWPAAWQDLAGNDHRIDPQRWLGYERMFSKQAWLLGQAEDGAWPLAAGAPGIAAFFSFKGGVGRSTLLGVAAWQLAQAGKRVVCIDLDLEAPGLARLFGCRESPVGVLEFLLAHAATGQPPAGPLLVDAQIHGQTIQVMTAGAPSVGFVHKLARLDYLGSAAAEDSPVEQALRILLTRIRGEHRPDVILLDCRAGLHDLGALSLTDLAHVDVLVGRDTGPGRDGLGLVFDLLAARRRGETLRGMVAQTMIPLPLNGEVAAHSRARFSQAMYDACLRSIYAPLADDETPQPDDEQAPHAPQPIGFYDEVAAAQALGDIGEATLRSPSFQALRERLALLLDPAGEPEL